MKIKTIKEIPQLKGKKILVRVDFNVPLDKNGNIEDDSRITAATPTIEYLVKNKASIILITHLGRPKGEVKEELRVKPIADYLSKKLGKKIIKMKEILNSEVKKTVEKLKEGEIMILENIRFRKEEEENDKNFSKELSTLADLYINDAFGTAHRAHSSTEGVTHYLPSYAGFLMEKEIKALSPLIEKEPDRPLIMILGGAKISSKINLIRAFMEKSDYMVLGGGLANTFLAAAGYNIGNSLYEDDKVETAREIMLEFEKNHEKLSLPIDVIAADEISENSESVDAPIEDILGSMKIADIGKWTAEKYCNLILECATVIWNGPMGIYEFSPFKNGTKSLAECISKHNCNSIIGGGDTVDAIKKSGVKLDKFTHVSTGGGACIEFLEGKTLPGIKQLLY